MCNAIEYKRNKDGIGKCQCDWRIDVEVYQKKMEMV